MNADKSSPAERQRAQYRKGQAEKFAWIKKAGADRTLGDATFRVLSLCAIHEAGGKGHWTGKRVKLAQLCGVSVRKFDRAIADGIAKNYIYTDLDTEDRRAHIYHMFTIEERNKMFYEELNEWEREKRRAEYERRQCFLGWLRQWREDVQRFFDAEKAFVQAWLAVEFDAEHDYKRRLFDAIYARCGNSDFAMLQARSAWDEHRSGRLSTPLPDIIAEIAAMPQDRFPDPDADTVVGAADGNNPAESGNYLAGSVDKVAESGDYVAESEQVVTNHDALTTANAQTPYAQVLQVPQVLEVAPATPGGDAGAQEQHITPAPAVDWAAHAQRSRLQPVRRGRLLPRRGRPPGRADTREGRRLRVAGMPAPHLGERR